MKRRHRTGKLYAENDGQGRWFASCAAGILVLALLAGALAGCGGTNTGNPFAAAQESSQEEGGVEESRENDGKRDENSTENDSGDSAVSADMPVIKDGKVTLGDMEISLEPDDKYTVWDEDSAVMILLDDSQITIDGQGATAQGSTVTIETSGTYILKGSLSNGTILVDAGDHDNVRLVFDGVDIHSETSAPVDIKNAGKTIISLEEGSVNSLSDSPNLIYRNEEKEEPNGALFSKGDLTINGSGTLKVDGTFNNGICSKDVLKIVGGTFEVTAANHGVKGNDALVIYDGSLTVSAVGDGIKSDTLAAVLGGDILITDCEEGIEAETVIIQGGTIDLTAGDDGINASTDGTNTPYIYFMGGTVTVRAEGDGIDSNGSIHMSGGQVTVYGPSGRDNGALDYDREFHLTGGTIMAFGPGGMEQNVSSADSQVSVLADFGETLAAGTEVSLLDQDGKELCKAAGEKDFRTVVISVPEMATGSQYQIKAGESVISFVPEQNLIYVNKDGVQEAAAMGPGRGGQGGRGGRMNGGPEGEPGERPEFPEDESRPNFPEDAGGGGPEPFDGREDGRSKPSDGVKGGARPNPSDKEEDGARPNSPQEQPGEKPKSQEE